MLKGQRECEHADEQKCKAQAEDLGFHKRSVLVLRTMWLPYFMWHMLTPMSMHVVMILQIIVAADVKEALISFIQKV